jgi:hypothetical protein
MEALLSKLKKEREEAYLELLQVRQSMEDCGYCSAHTKNKNKGETDDGLEHHHTLHQRTIRRATELVKGYDIVIKTLQDAVDMVDA